MLGVLAIYRDDKDAAVTSFARAANMDPANQELVSCYDELSRGTFDVNRVAKTAARLYCHKKVGKLGAAGTDNGEFTKGLLARGLFADYSEYKTALRKARQDRGFHTAYNNWLRWECR